MWKYVFLSYRVHELHQLQSNEQQNKCDRKKGKENPSDPSILTAKRCKCLQWMLNRCVKHLPLCFQITLLEERCSALPTASSLPGGSTDNEVDASRPTLPPGENTFKCFFGHISRENFLPKPLGFWIIELMNQSV